MQVILNQDVEKIGQRGDIVDVSRGYVRNFLVPRGLAEVATPGKLEEARRSMEESEERNRRLAERAEEISGILNKSVITIEARTGEDERLFGSVTAANIADAVEKGPRYPPRQTSHPPRRAHKGPGYAPGAHPGPRRSRSERKGDRGP